MEFTINQGQLLREVKFSKLSDNSIKISFYDEMLGKKCKLFIERYQIDEIIEILNKLK